VQLVAPNNTPKVAQQVHANVRAIAAIAARIRSTATKAHVAVEFSTGLLAQPLTVFAILSLAAAWCTYNALAAHFGSATPDPPPFFWLQGALSLYAAVVSTTVLIVQSRQTRETEQRAQLELQVNLLAEQKATKIIALLEELRRDLPSVANRDDPVATAMQEAVDPHAVMSALETTTEWTPSQHAGEGVHGKGIR
jgi:uncharacterized membrane protein